VRDKTWVTGKITTGVSLMYTTLGLGAQVWKNWQRHSVEGVSIFMFVMLLATFGCWITYGTFKRDSNMIISNIPGAICAMLILIQTYLYS
jgi:uncharacterized protein with PQ loop repeat